MLSPERTTESSAPEVHVVANPGAIECNIATLLGAHGDPFAHALVERTLTLDSVESVAINRRSGVFRVEFDALENSVGEMLRQLSLALDEDLIDRWNEAGLTCESRPATNGLWRAANLCAAGGCFLASIVGVITPGIPTVPFVLATSYFLVRSAPGLNDKLRHSRLFGTMVRDWEDRGGMRRRTKLQIVAMMCVMIGLGLRAATSPALLVAMLAVAGIDLLVVLKIPTVEDNDRRPSLTQLHAARPRALLPAC